MLRRVLPRECLAVVGCVFIAVGAWAWLTPAYLAPDENVHTGHVQKFAESGGFDGGSLPGYRSTEQVRSSEFTQSDYVAGNPLVQPARESRTYEEWLDLDFPDALQGNAAGPNAAESNPPLYYVLASVPYRLGAGADLLTRVMLMRLLGVLFACLLAVAVWHLAAELLPRGPGRVVAALVAGVMPMANFIESSVSPDGAMYALWAFVFLAGVKSIRYGGLWIAAMIVAFILAMGVKYQSASLLPAVLLVVAVLVYRHAPWPRAPRLRVAMIVGGSTVAVAAFVFAGREGWLGTQVADALQGTAGNSLATSVRLYLSYLWQYYLPRPGFLEEVGIPDRIDPWDTLFIEYWGGFSWHEVRYAPLVYWVILGVLVVLIAGAVKSLMADGRWRRHAIVVAFLAVPAITLFLGLHWTDFKMLRDGSPFIQGRYFLPLTPLLGLIAGAAVGPALGGRARLQSVASGGLVGLLLILNLLAFGAVLERFYA